jgi:hypothetical protein
VFGKVMKRAFLFCGAVILLLLVSGRVGAQGDSLLLQVRSYVTVPDTEYIHTSVGDYTFQGTKNLSYNYTLNIPREDTGNVVLTSDLFLPYLYLQFNVDTEEHMIRNLRFYEDGTDEYNAYSLFQVLVIDSVPFVRPSSNTIEVSLQPITCTYQYSYGYEDQRTGFTDYTQSSGTAIDTLSFTLSPVSPSAVTLSSSNNINFLWRYPSILEFTPSNFERELYVFSSLGSLILKQDLLAGCGHVQLAEYSFPPGCYFAHLGDQMTKFIVPPR